jgi:hypothetical protein
MSGNKAVLDTNVIIFASKRIIDFQKLVESYDDFYVSIITYMEVYGYEFEKPEEKQLIDLFFEGLEVIELNKEIVEQVIVYRKSKTKKIKLPDAIILATAKYLDAELITNDWDDFENIDNSVLIAKIDN